MFTRTRFVLASFAVAAALLPSATAASANTDKSGQNDGKSIFGGYYPSTEAWPWVTALQDRTAAADGDDFGQNVCTAVLVAPQRVLTAAHCVVGADRKTPRPAATFQVLVGRRDLHNTAQGERRNVTGVAVHPKVYLPVSAGIHQHHAFYDIAVLFLDQPVSTTPATIGAPTDWNSWATAMGWGHSNLVTDPQDRVFDPVLRAADFTLFNDAQCGAAFNTAEAQHFYPSIHVCAGNAQNAAKVSCITHGDSGGPLMVLTNAGWRLLGITSFYPQRNDPQCPGHGGPFGFAWVAGPEMREWPLTVEHPPIVSEGTTGGGGSTGGDGNTGGGDTTGGGGNTTVTPDRVDLAMSRADAYRYIRSMIRGETNGAIKGLKRSCTARGADSFRCRISWRIGRRAYSGTATFRHYAENNEVYWSYSFKGKSKQRGRTARKISW